MCKARKLNKPLGCLVSSLANLGSRWQAKKKEKKRKKKKKRKKAKGRKNLLIVKKVNVCYEVSIKEN